ncbi:hypothetical protein KIW84_064481 [Lathyrus oleraceus]|uniref:DUF7745 domain-containing protein n=1 Tax=Pisum sativum TaxID=3888 RepID=A0A9D4WAB8_PEA|nr:hypothetical protein KIW84_064481 [Pisum sativum]
MMFFTSSLFMAVCLGKTIQSLRPRFGFANATRNRSLLFVLGLACGWLHERPCSASDWPRRILSETQRLLTHLSLTCGLCLCLLGLTIDIDVVCLSELCTDLCDVSTDMERPKRHTKKYSFRQPDLKELRNLTSYVLDPLGFKARYGKLLPLLTTQVDEGLMSTLAQFYDPLYHCFSFSDFQLLPTLEEYAHLVGIPILDQVEFRVFLLISSSLKLPFMGRP